MVKKIIKLTKNCGYYKVLSKESFSAKIKKNMVSFSETNKQLNCLNFVLYPRKKIRFN